MASSNPILTTLPPIFLPSINPLFSLLCCPSRSPRHCCAAKFSRRGNTHDAKTTLVSFLQPIYSCCAVSHNLSNDLSRVTQRENERQKKRTETLVLYHDRSCNTASDVKPCSTTPNVKSSIQLGVARAILLPSQKGGTPKFALYKYVSSKSNGFIEVTEGVFPLCFMINLLID